MPDEIELHIEASTWLNRPGVSVSLLVERADYYRARVIDLRLQNAPAMILDPITRLSLVSALALQMAMRAHELISAA